MSKVLPLLLILLIIIAISGCITTSSGSDAAATNTTTNQNKAKIAATRTPIIKPTPTPTLFIIQHENSTVNVEIKGSEFKPAELRIMKGTIVKWKNMDDARYIINGTDFNSPQLDRRDTWAYTFNKPGTFEYNCPDHPWMQRGRITVE